MRAAGGVALAGLNDYQVARIKNQLTFANPAYTKAVALEQPTQGICETILGYKEHDGELIVPKHFRAVPEQSIRNEIVEKRPAYLKSLRTSPRSEQLDVVEQMEAAFPRDLGLSLPCGFGKTYLALFYATKFVGRVLVVCPTTVKLQEWQGEIQKHLGLDKKDIGRIQASTRDWEDKAITVTMLKTLATQDFPIEVLTAFDLVIWDEAHLCGAPVLSQALGRVWGTNLTLTATPGRGVRRKLLELHNGDNWIIQEGTQDVKVSAYFIDVPVPRYIQTLDWRFQKIQLAKSKMYSQTAMKHVDSAIDSGRRVLVLNSQISPLLHLIDSYETCRQRHR